MENKSSSGRPASLAGPGAKKLPKAPNEGIPGRGASAVSLLAFFQSAVEAADRSHLDAMSPAMDNGNLPPIRDPRAPSREADCLARGGDLGAHMREFDWSLTPVGPVTHWPHSLSFAVALCLNSRLPTAIWWGREHQTMFYNDAYQSIVGRADRARWLGRSGRDYWGNDGDIRRQLIERVFDTGEAACAEDQVFVANQTLPLEEVYFTFSFSPIVGENGTVDGTFCSGVETTARVVAERRLRSLRDLAAGLADSKTAEETCVHSARILAANSHDVPFCLIYKIDDDGASAKLTAASGIEPGTDLAPLSVNLATTDDPWPFSKVCRTGRPELVQNLANRLGPQPGGPWPEPAQAALGCPMAAPAGSRPLGVMIGGIGARRILDNDYRDFLELAAGQVAAAIAQTGREQARSQTWRMAAVPLEHAARGTAVGENQGPLQDESPRAVDLIVHARLEFLRREAELALRESEQRFARFMQHLPGLAWIKDVQGCYVYANDAALKAFRTGRADLYGKTDQELFTSDDAERFRANDRRALASETGIQTIETLEHDDGILHHSMVSKFPIPGWDNQPALVGGIAVDITDLIHAQAAIRESEERFRGLAEAMPQMVYVASAQGDNEYMSQRWRDYTGLCHADEASIREVVHPDDYSLMIERWREAAARDSPFEAEVRIRRASDGVYRWFLTRALPVPSATGVGTKWFGTCTDIDGQKRAEERQHVLAEAGRIFSSPLDYQPTLANVCKLVVPIFADWCSLELLGEDGQLQYREVAHSDPAKVELAREYRRRYPARPDDRVGVMRVFRTGQPEFFPEVSDELLVRGARDQEELHRLRELGLRSVMIVPLTARGRTLGTLTLVTAESSRRYGEDDLRLALELGSRAALAVDNARLFEELRANDRRKDEFLAMLAHELRNPLAAIDNAVSLIELPDAGRHNIDWSTEVISRHVRHLTRLIDDLLDVSRITRGKIQLRKTKIDACPVFKSAIESVRPLFEERKHRLSTAFGPDLILDADPTRLEQIAVNLLSNAAKYTESHGQIWFSARRANNEIVIQVRDTGIGITSEQLPNVFEPFVQGDRSLERAAGGLGIGLTLVRKLTELHGGTVMARSDGPGKGSEFTVTLPAVSETVSEQSRPAAKPDPTTSRRARILVVDDNEDLARGLARLLELHGHAVQIAFDGPAGLSLARKWHPEFILLDIGLPGMDGYQVTAHLRQDDDTKNAVIIAISGYGQEEDRNRSRQAGFDHHLVKPISSSDLIKVLDKPR